MYDASEDSYLLRNALTDDDPGGETAIDIGVGSGVITSVLLERFDEVIGVDIDPDALQHCRAEFPGATIHRSDRFEAIDDVAADIITCNPPYLPSKPGHDPDPALDGGPSGAEYTVAFLDEARSYLADDGDVWFVASSKADVESIEDALSRFDYTYDVVASTRYFFEELYVYRATQNS